MKKLIILSLFVLISIILFISCKKQPTENIQNKETLESRASIIENNILNFKENIKLFEENPGLKLSDPMHIDTCIWYIESTLNYTYADVKNDRDTMYFDSCFVDIDLISGRVEISEAVAAYGMFEDSLSAQYNAITETNEHFVLADVFVVSATSSEATLCMLSVFVAGGPINTMSFSSTYDYWWFGNGSSGSGGYCGGPYNGQDLYDDAAQQIEQKVRYRAAVPSGRYYSINDFTLFFQYDHVVEYGTSNFYTCSLENPNDTTADDNYFDFLVYRSYSGNDNHHGCMGPNELNWYLNKMEYVIYTRLYNCVDEIEDLDFISLDMLGDQFTHNGNTTYAHKSWATYGELIFTSTGVEDLD